MSFVFFILVCALVLGARSVEDLADVDSVVVFQLPSSLHEYTGTLWPNASRVHVVPAIALSTTRESMTGRICGLKISREDGTPFERLKAHVLESFEGTVELQPVGTVDSSLNELQLWMEAHDCDKQPHVSQK
ncbi:hypothetical protein Ciccas_013630 [Cichlidogyrus casuarinus]|uniref:Uncharacterized protein n=1 Tax=Cichlidogyrus casuarinus TaxID=1844966 RepID=A0ABD2PK35_9PLAT